VERAKMILGCLDGRSMADIARELRVRPNTVILWRRRFSQEGLAGLKDRPRSGKPVEHGPEFRKKVLELLETPAPKGQACWDGPAVAKRLDVSPHAVWRLLRKEGICLRRQRSWCVSTDPEFVAKAADIVGLYLNPPENALVLSIDEKPSIQALERATGYVETSSGKIVRGLRGLVFAKLPAIISSWFDREEIGYEGVYAGEEWCAGESRGDGFVDCEPCSVAGAALGHG